MKKLLLRDLLKAVNGKFYGNEKILEDFILNINLDSRKVIEKSLFIAIKGEKYDAHDFINQAVNNGAVCVISEKMLDLNLNINFIKVESSKQALLDLAEYYRNLFDIKIIAVTGSCGKTTTKDMIASVLSQDFNVVKTLGNLNNNIGLPLSVFEISDETQVAVLEMGTNHFGEINKLSKVARPDICVINNIGVAHIENFLSQDGILKAKSEIFDYAKNNFLVILNGDDKYLRKINFKDNNKVIYCGLDKKNDVYAYDIDDKKNSFKVNVFNGDYEIKLDLPGEFLIKDALIAIGLGKYFNISDKKIKFALENFRFNNMRLEFIDKENFVIINDAYNANPDSMKAGIDTLLLTNKDNIKNKICILGDMLELGVDSKKYHYEIGVYLSDKNKKNNDIRLVICIGELAKNIFDGITGIERKYYKTKQDFFCDLELNKALFCKSMILIKASLGMNFKEIIDRL